MVIVKVMGGFGNQLFQYAFGKEIEKKFGFNVKYDLTYYDDIPEGDTPRENYLRGLIEKEKTVSKKDIDSFIRGCKIRSLFSIKWHIKLFERDIDLQNLSGIVDNCYYIGYWQSEKYFRDVIEDISNDIQKCYSIRSLKAKELLDEISKSNSVAIHVRGGDYLNAINIGTFGNICDSNYYIRGYEYINSNTENCKFYLFTNDVEWTKNNIDLPYENITVVSEVLGEEDTIDEFVLMANCKHNIIANSTYSWWAAWLNANQKKIVVEPCKWANDDTGIAILKDEWVRVN